MLVTDLTPGLPLLLDTGVWGHVMVGDTAVLPTSLLAEIERAAHDHRLFASAISVWEIARQIELGNLFVNDLGALVANQERPPGVSILPIAPDVIVEAHHLPAFAPGRDPSARFIAATARLHAAVVVTTDPAFISMADGGVFNVFAITPALVG